MRQVRERRANSLGFPTETLWLHLTRHFTWLSRFVCCNLLYLYWGIFNWTCTSSHRYLYVVMLLYLCQARQGVRLVSFPHRMPDLEEKRTHKLMHFVCPKRNWYQYLISNFFLGGGGGGDGGGCKKGIIDNAKWQIGEGGLCCCPYLCYLVVKLFCQIRFPCYGCTQRSLLEQRFLGDRRFHLISESVYPFMVFCGRGGTQESSLCFQYKFTQ